MSTPPLLSQSPMEWRHRYAALINARRKVFYNWPFSEENPTYGGNLDSLLGECATDLRAGRIFWRDLIHPQDKSHFERSRLAAIERGEAYHLIYRVVLPTGVILSVQDDGQVVFDAVGQKDRVLGLLEDVSERELARRELSRSEERYELAAEAVSGIIYDHDPSSGQVNWSSGLLEVLGYSPDDVPDRWDWWLQQIHPAEFSEVTLKWEHRQFSHGPEVTEYRVRHRDGHFLHLLDRALASRDDDGKILRIVGCAQDVTARKKLESQLRDRLVELGRSARLKDEFLAMLAHELRNPLVPLRNGLHLYRIGVANAETQAMMERQVRLMVRLIDDLLDVSRISQGKITLELRIIDLISAIYLAIETSRPLIEQGGYQFVVELPSIKIEVDADLARFAQVFSNILNNACKFTPSGGLIELKAGIEGFWAVIRVRDTGIGIGREDIDRIFDLFVQAEDSPQHGQGGLGIGLTLVKRLVEMHGGTVDVASQGLGQGSEFVVRVPLASRGRALVENAEKVDRQ